MVLRCCCECSSKIELFHDSIILCTSTLYNWIDSGIMQIENFNLPEKIGQKLRSTKGKEHRNKKVLGTLIEDRSKSVEERKEFEHWSNDTVIEKKNADEPNLITLVERKTTVELIFKIDGKRAECIDDTLKTFIG